MGVARRTDDETAAPVITIKGSLKTGYKRFQAAFCYSETLAKALGGVAGRAWMPDIFSGDVLK